MRECYAGLPSAIAARGLAPLAITIIKGVHTLIFAVLMSLVLQVMFAGLRGRFTDRDRVALAAIAGETLVIALNEGRCPLTDLVEDLGSEHGSVSDIFLPDWFAQRIPLVSGALLAAGGIGWTLRRIVRSQRAD